MVSRASSSSLPSLFIARFQLCIELHHAVGASDEDRTLLTVVSIGVSLVPVCTQLTHAIQLTL